jgi:hypothetical protein
MEAAKGAATCTAVRDGTPGSREELLQAVETRELASYVLQKRGKSTASAEKA